MPAVSCAQTPTSLELTSSILGTARPAGGAPSWLTVARVAEDVDVPPRLEALHLEETGEVVDLEGLPRGVRRPRSRGPIAP